MCNFIKRIKCESERKSPHQTPLPHTRLWLLLLFTVIAKNSVIVCEFVKEDKVSEKDLHSAPHSSLIEDDDPEVNATFRFQAETIQSKINARNMELDKIQKDIFLLEADEATFKGTFSSKLIQ